MHRVIQVRGMCIYYRDALPSWYTTSGWELGHKLGPTCTQDQLNCTFTKFESNCPLGVNKIGLLSRHAF